MRCAAARWRVLVMVWVWAWATASSIEASNNDGGVISECAARSYGNSYRYTFNNRSRTDDYTESTFTEGIALDKTLSSQEQVALIAAAIPTAYPKYRLGDMVRLSRQRDLWRDTYAETWPTSFATLYMQRTNLNNNMAVLAELLDDKNYPRSPADAVVVHLRLGDILDNAKATAETLARQGGVSYHMDKPYRILGSNEIIRQLTLWGVDGRGKESDGTPKGKEKEASPTASPTIMNRRLESGRLLRREKSTKKKKKKKNPFKEKEGGKGAATNKRGTHRSHDHAASETQPKQICEIILVGGSHSSDMAKRNQEKADTVRTIVTNIQLRRGYAPDPNTGDFNLDSVPEAILRKIEQGPGAHPNSKSAEYVQHLEMALSEQGYEVRLRLGANPDEDFAFMASAEWFVQGAGGYSELIAMLVAARAGPGRVRQIDGLPPEQRHTKNPFHSELQPGNVGP